MDAFSYVMAVLAVVFVMSGAYIFGFCRDRRGAPDRRSTSRAHSAGRRRSDLRAISSKRASGPATVRPGFELEERRAA